MSLTNEQLMFMGVFFSIWFVLSFIMVMLYAIWEERKNDKYRAMFTIKDIFVMLLFAPFTLVCGLLFIIMWFCLRVLHLEDLVDAISDFMNRPIRLRGKDKDNVK